MNGSVVAIFVTSFNFTFRLRSPSGPWWWWLRQIFQRRWRLQPRARPSSTIPPGSCTPSTVTTTVPGGIATAGSASPACIMPTGSWSLFRNEMGFLCYLIYYNKIAHILYRSIPGVLVQEVLVTNPTGNSVIFNVERVGVDRWDGAKTLTRTWATKIYYLTWKNGLHQNLVNEASNNFQQFFHDI